MNSKKRLRSQALLWAGHIGALLPLALLVYDFTTRNLTANPIQAATLRTGKAALVLLVLSLAVTPVCSLLGWSFAQKLRKPFGLYAFLYASLHFLIFIWVDLGLNWAFILDGFLQKPYALVGFAAFLLLVPLAITSTRGWQRRLGKTWKKLHRLVYVAGLLVIVHYVWLVKSDVREPLLWGAGVVFLLAARTRPVKHAIRAVSARLRRRKRPTTEAMSESSRTAAG